MPSHPLVTFDFSQAWMSLIKIILTYLLTFPIGWEREREAHSVGVRTFPIVADCELWLSASGDVG